MNYKHIIFDLDETLYTSETMTRGITNRMISLVAEFFNISFEEAKILRKKSMPLFGTTLEWLASKGFSDINYFFAKAHPESEIDEVDFDENLRPLLQSLKMPMSILTNSPIEHAERVLKKLNVLDLFENITDIRATNLRGKPYAMSYITVLKKANCEISEAIFLDDQKKYADGFEILGGTSVVIGNSNGDSLQADSDAAIEANKLIATGTIAKPTQQGKSFHITSVYDLPVLLQKLQNL